MEIVRYFVLTFYDTKSNYQCWTTTQEIHSDWTFSYVYYLTTAVAMLHLYFPQVWQHFVEPSLKHYAWEEGVRFHIVSAKCGQPFCLSLVSPCIPPLDQPIPLGHERSECQHKPTLLLYWSQSEDNYRCVCVLTWDVGKNRKGQGEWRQFVHVPVHVYMCAGCEGVVWAWPRL